MVRIFEQPVRRQVKGFLSLFNHRPVCQDDSCPVRYECQHSVFCEEQDDRIDGGNFFRCQHGNFFCTRNANV